MPLLAYLMVSKIEFLSIKQMHLGRMRRTARLALGMLIALIWYKHQIGFLVLAWAYCGSGPVNAVLRKRSGMTREPISSQSAQPAVKGNIVDSQHFN